MFSILASVEAGGSAVKRSRLQYFSIGEQILLSTSNMIASVVVVKAAGVEWFGIYSFIFVLTVFTSAFFASLLHSQMMLEISAKDVTERCSIFLATVVMQTFFLVCLAGLAGVCLVIFADAEIVRKYQSEMIASLIFVFLFNYYELFKQYLYVVNDQAYSFRCTSIYITFLFLLLIVIFLYVNPNDVTAWVFRAFSICLLGGILFNFRCIETIYRAKWLGLGHTWSVFITYFSHGKFSLVSMLITWVQNQSMSPVLMWLSGPLVVGYFNLARLMIMPMAVINTGLTKSSTPGLRRAFKTEGWKSLDLLISGLIQKNVIFASVYVLLLFVLHFSGLLDRFVPAYNEVFVYLLIWIAISLTTMYRAWRSQFFIISMQFKFLLRVCIAALLVTFAGMFAVGYGYENIKLALLFVVLGELTSVFLFRREQIRTMG